MLAFFWFLFSITSLIMQILEPENSYWVVSFFSSIIMCRLETLDAD